MKRRKLALLEPQLPGYSHPLTLDAQHIGVSSATQQCCRGPVNTQVIAGFTHEHAQAACAYFYKPGIVHLMMRPLTAPVLAGQCAPRPVHLQSTFLYIYERSTPGQSLHGTEDLICDAPHLFPARAGCQG